MTNVCTVPWCVIAPADGDALCAIHRAHPVYPNESADDWRVRVSKFNRVLKRRQHAMAMQDARDATKKATP